jgi:serine/threonine protein phosphatase PrpC
MSEDAAAPLAAPERPKRLAVRTAQKSDVGLVRSENQDFAILSSPEEQQGSVDRGRLMIVADGMGGHRGGATASRMAATTIKEEYLRGEFSDPATVLRRALQMANQRIFNEAQNNAELRGMGTTCSALVIRGDQAWFAHVGDSRIYLIRDDDIKQLTQDHSLVASMVREGLITSQEAEVHPRRNVLQRSMGVIEQVEIDVSPPLQVRAGDIYVLCSDGLHGLVKDKEMKEVARMPIDRVATEFVQRAIERGAPDNVTVVVAQVIEGEPSDEPVQPRVSAGKTMELPIPEEEAAAAAAAAAQPTPEMLVPPPMADLPSEEPVVAEAAMAESAPAEEAVPFLSESAAETSDPARDVMAARAAAPYQIPGEKRGGGFMRWLLLAVVAVAVIGAVYYFLTQRDAPESTPPGTTTTQR